VAPSFIDERLPAGRPMTTVPQLGPGASLLLGMLGSPMTTDELHVHIMRSLELPFIDEIDQGWPGVRPGSTKLTLQRIADGGSDEIDRLMERLREYRFVEKVDDPFGGTLWRRLDLG
jgi:hypothetical protein